MKNRNLITRSILFSLLIVFNMFSCENLEDKEIYDEEKDLVEFINCLGIKSNSKIIVDENTISVDDIVLDKNYLSKESLVNKLNLTMTSMCLLILP